MNKLQKDNIISIHIRSKMKLLVTLNITPEVPIILLINIGLLGLHGNYMFLLVYRNFQLDT